MSERELQRLTPKERDVLIFVGKGYSNPEIAQMLGNQRETIKHHMRVISRKLGACNRGHAVMIAAKAGWL